MPRILGVDIPADKQVGISLTYIYGIGPTFSRNILKEANIEMTMRAKDLTEEQLSHLAGIIEKKYVIEGQLRRQVSQNISRLREINCWRGLRHRKGLPVRGQRTKTNARTRKGPKKTVAGKKSVKQLSN